MSARGAVAACIAAGVLLHLALATTLGLSPDEAHYALYGAHADWSYYDHPPLAGWLQAPFVALGGGDVAMRVVPMLCWVATVVLSVAAGRRLPLGPRPPDGEPAVRDAWIAGLLLLCPMLDLLGVALVPDSLLMPLVPAALLATWRLRDAAVALRARAWLPLGVVLGLAVLSKYTALFLVLSALVGLARFHGRHLPRLPGFWLAAAIVLAAATPVLAWNAAHGWSSIAYQSAHAAGGRAWRAVDVARALLVQLAMYGVVLPAGAWRGLHPPLRRMLPRLHRPLATTDAHALVLGFALPVLVVAMALAGRGGSLPHWTACGWTALVPLAAAGLATMARGWSRGLAAWQAAFLVVLCATLWTGGPGRESDAAATAPPGTRAPPNPVADLYGWDAAARHAAALARARQVGSLSVANWSLASRIAWYARPLPVHVVQDRGDQFTLWFGTLRDGDATILVDASGLSFAPPLGTPGFRRCETIDRTPVVVGGRPIAHFTFMSCEGWHR